MFILVDDEAEKTDNTWTSAGSAAAMPPENMGVLQVSKRWRQPTIANTPSLDLGLDASQVRGVLYDVVAIIGYDGLPTRNMLRRTHELDISPWVEGADASVSPSVVDQSIPTLKPFASYTMTSGGGSADYVEQTIDKPGKAGSATAMAIRVGIIAKDVDAGNDINLRITAFSTISTQEAWSNFDLTAGTAGTNSASGAFTFDSASITAIGNGWYLCILNCTTDTADTLTLRYQALDGTSTTVPVNDELGIGLPATYLQTAEASIAEYPDSDNDGGAGPMWSIDIRGLGAVDVGFDTDWMHCAQRNSLRGFSRFDFYHRFSSLLPHRDITVDFYDPYNENTYIEAGRMLAGRAVDIDAVLVTYALEAEEIGEQLEAEGGQIYRPQNAVRRRIRVDLEFLTKEQALDTAYFLERVRGRSRQVLLVMDEQLEGAESARYGQEHMIYGYIDRLDPVPIQSPRIHTRWRWSFTILETP